MSSIPPVPSLPAQSSWVVTPAEKAQYDAQFALADLDRDGYVSGAEIKHAFLESGLPQSTLAHIWALCDTRALGKLSRAQYALAMWLVARALRGTPPPAALAPDMLPPDDEQQAPLAQAAGAAGAVPAPVGGALQLGAQPTPEMEAIAREVEALARERLALDADRADKQHALNTAAAEGHALQSELDTLTATLKQLENQKGEAQKRLNDLKTQVEKLRSQVSAQEAAAAETEAEVAARRAAAHTLKEKERALQQEVSDAHAHAEALTAQLRKTVLAVSQANIKISHLEEHHRVLEEACAALSSAAGGAEALLQLQPLHARDHLQRLVRGATPNDALEDESFPQSNGFEESAPGAFASDPFKDSPFSSVPQNDPFAPTTNNNNAVKDGFASDPFASDADPFAGDAFAPQDTAANTNDDGAWADPFAVLHAPARDATPTPALPPKRHKTPPPRPAPPRPTPPHKTDRANMDFTDDPFKDYRYEDPFNIEDPFADAAAVRADPAARPTSVAGFETDDFFASSTVNGSFTLPEKRSGRVSAPPVAYDPFSGRSEFNTANNNETWAAWPNDNWATDSAWTEPTSQKADAWSAASKNTNVTTNDRKTENWANKSDNWANKSDNWATDWSMDQNKNLNETWPNTLPAKKEKSPRPVKYAKSLVNTIGGIGRSRQKEKKAKEAKEAKELRASAEALPSEETQWAWAAAESRRLQRAAEQQRRREDAELQLALAISRQDK
ncbi:hypothetical protein O3G_MSEX009491 [Manduca sexta]|uniref:Epidermal growth factor receptor substrate 15-like 1 n=2 Tax=Manduca sexta TaxID=7130 RepID=A0A921ZEJ3_MANSE|nr:hypothetical protein O3G_MSEX009491 [Manduca sexta]